MSSKLFRALEDRQPESAREAATAVRALVYRASTAGGGDVADAALAKATAIADKMLLSFNSDDVVEDAAAIVGLVAVAAAQGDAEYLSAADALFQEMSADTWLRGGRAKPRLRGPQWRT